MTTRLNVIDDHERQLHHLAQNRTMMMVMKKKMNHDPNQQQTRRQRKPPPQLLQYEPVVFTCRLLNFVFYKYAFFQSSKNPIFFIFLSFQASLTDKTTPEYQRLAWEALKKTMNGRVNKINTSNLTLIIRELFKDNIVRGRGILARGIIQAQTASPFYTAVYAALVSVINTKFPQIGELIVKRLISSFRRTYQRNDKTTCLACSRFIAHLVNQNVVCIDFFLIESKIHSPLFFFSI